LDTVLGLRYPAELPEVRVAARTSSLFVVINLSKTPVVVSAEISAQYAVLQDASCSPITSAFKSPVTASNGGAYGRGEDGAYGRLAAWQSLAALTGVGASGTADDVYTAAKQSSWWSISSTSKWFYNIAWDFTIVCLRPDRRHIAVLAATDED
jgi:hypothetical protein